MTTFASFDGEYLVSVQGKFLSREELWYYSVGRLLRDQLATHSTIYRSYVAADVGCSQPKSVVDRLRSLPRLAGRVKISTVFRQAPMVAYHIPPTATPHSVVRQVQREYRREVEAHFPTIFVLFGSMLPKFLATQILCRQTLRGHSALSLA